MNDHSIETLQSDPIIDQLRHWLVKHRPEAGDIKVDANIIESRVIDSLQFVSFLLYVEELRGKPIPADDVQLENFATLSAIRRNFF
jgi:acyl carrier protein